ncbi:MAG: Yip1 family protein [Candidatus Margulisiibacteriota bacterium]
MGILKRARDIIFNPRGTWQVVKSEAIDIKQLFVNYAAPLALIPAVCSLIGITLIGIRMPGGNVVRAPFVEALIGGAVGFVLHLAGILIGGWAVKLLAPLFNSKPDLNSAIKIVVYSMTPVWLAGIFSILPGLGILSILGLYGIYLLALSLPVILETPPNKVVWYTVSIVLASIVISIILSIVMVPVYGPMFMRMMAV